MYASRRRFVCALAAASAGTLAARHVTAQQTAARTRRVDFHHHFQLAAIMAIDASPRSSSAPTTGIARQRKRAVAS